MTDEQLQHVQARGLATQGGEAQPPPDADFAVDPALLALAEGAQTNGGTSNARSQPTPEQLARWPPVSVLRARLAAYNANNSSLEARIAGLKAQSSEQEGQYRKVVSLCTGVDENSVEGVLEGLLAAVESEDGGAAFGSGKGAVEVGRVREFLRKVEGAGAVEV